MGNHVLVIFLKELNRDSYHDHTTIPIIFIKKANDFLFFVHRPPPLPSPPPSPSPPSPPSPPPSPSPNYCSSFIIIIMKELNNHRRNHRRYILAFVYHLPHHSYSDFVYGTPICVDDVEHCWTYLVLYH